MEHCAMIAGNSITTNYVPIVATAEVDRFFRNLRQTVVNLENAYRKEILPVYLPRVDVESQFGTALFNVYWRLIRRPFIKDPQGRRIETVFALLEQVRDQLLETDTWFHAEKVESRREELELIDGSPRSSQSLSLYLATNSSGEKVLLRIDQVIEARNWRIGFVFGDPAETDRLSALTVKRSLEHLVCELNDLEIMLPRIAQAEPGRFPKLVAPLCGRVLEQLIVDILNEDSKQAQLTQLSEDYCQKTDIRVRYPELHRPRGARIQVTWAPTQFTHQRKVDSISRAKHYVIFSPWALADAAPQVGQVRSEHRPEFDNTLISRLWSSIEGQPLNTATLALEFRAMLNRALHSPVCDPRGPMAKVPPALRAYIREWVQFEAVRSTKALRQWEADGGTFQRRSDGRLSARSNSSSNPDRYRA
jgi:hypothetical protein